MSREKILSILLIGFGILGLLYLLGRKPQAVSPATGGGLANAGGAALQRTVASESAGVSGSIPSIIAAAAALTGQRPGSVAARTIQASGGAPAPGAIEPTMFDPTDPLVFQGLAGTQMVSTDSTGDPSLPGVSAGYGALDIPIGVTALDAGGLDTGTLQPFVA